MERDDKVQVISAETGEIKEGYFVYISYPKPKIRNKRWMMIFQDSLIKIAKDKEFTSSAKTVLFFLMGNLEFENYMLLRQVDIARELELDKSDVSKAMKFLINKEIVLKVKEGATTAYKLNSDYGWKGKVSNMEIEKERVLSQKIIDMDKAREFLQPDAPAPTNTIEITPDDIPY